MPLRDHFRAPLADRRSWEGVHGQWPMMIVIGPQPETARALRRRAAGPPGFVDRDRRGDLRGGRCRFPSSRRERQRRRGGDRGLGSAAADAGRRDRPAGSGRVRGTRLRHQVRPPARGRRRDRQPGQQGPARAPSRLRRQVRRLAPEPRLRRDRRSRHDPHVQPVWRPAGTRRPDRPVPGRRTASLYAVACRGARSEASWLLETWTHPLALGQPLPTLPLWLADEPRGPARAGIELRGDVPHPSAPPARTPSLWNRHDTCRTSRMSGRSTNISSRICHLTICRYTKGWRNPSPSESLAIRSMDDPDDQARDGNTMHACPHSLACMLAISG